MVQETSLGFPAHTLPYRRTNLPRRCFACFPSFFYPQTSIITPPVTASQRRAVKSAVGSTVTDR